MARLTVEETSRRIKGAVLQGDPSTVFEKYNFDSRSTAAGELFFALKASRDGHEYISHAHRMGAAGAVVSEPVTAPDKDFALIRVEDTLRALQDLGSSVLSDYSVKVIGITGSVGKTSTRAYTSAVLGTRFKILESEKNFNNHIGVPITLLRLDDSHELAVLEMGMNSPGEIRRLTEIAPPDCAVITNIQPVHLEFFNSLDEIALAKKEILEGLRPGGTAVLNGDDARVRKIAEGLQGEALYFGSFPGCRIRISEVTGRGLEGMDATLNYGEEATNLWLPFLYRSCIHNFLAAAAVGFVFGIPLEAVRNTGERLQPLPMRGQLIRIPGGLDIVDDSYNSNPAALSSALESLSTVPAGRHVAVLGDMLELGQEEERFHIEAGELVHSLGWDCLVTVGPLSRFMAKGALDAGMDKSRIFSFEDAEAVCREAATLFHTGDLLLVKGSRGIGMDKIVNDLKRGH